MATLQELRSVFRDSDLHEKVESALIIAVQAKLDGTPSVDEMRYAAAVFDTPQAEANKAVMSLLASNSTATVAQILGATDPAIQTRVDAVIDTLVTAYIALPSNSAGV